MTPAWAQPIATRRPFSDELLACAIVERHLVSHGREGRVFRELARAAKREWTRRGKTSDEALQVVYELLRLAPGISECLDRREFAWLGMPLAVIEERPDEFEHRVRKKAGAPSRNAYLRAMFDALRWPRSSDGRPHFTFKEAKDAIAVLRSKPNFSFKQAVDAIAAVVKWNEMPEAERAARDAKEADRIFGRARAMVTEQDRERVRRAIRPSRADRSKRKR